MEKAVNREVNCIFRRRNGNRMKYGLRLFVENYEIYFDHSVDSVSFRFPIKKDIHVHKMAVRIVYKLALIPETVR